MKVTPSDMTCSCSVHAVSSIITVDEAGNEHRLHLIERGGWPWLPTRPYRDGEEEERQQLELTNPSPYVRPTAMATDIIEDMVRAFEFRIPRTLQEVSC